MGEHEAPEVEPQVLDDGDPAPDPSNTPIDQLTEPMTGDEADTVVEALNAENPEA